MSRQNPGYGSPLGSRSSVVDRLADMYGPPRRNSPLRAAGRSRGPRFSLPFGRRRSIFGYDNHERRRRRWKWGLGIFAVLAVAIGGSAVYVVESDWIAVKVSGVGNGDIIRGDQLPRLAFHIKAGGKARGKVIVMFNGVAVDTTPARDGSLVVALNQAAPGANRINWRVTSRYPFIGDKTGQIAFTVRFGPSLSVPRTIPPPVPGHSSLLRGLADDDVIVTVNGKAATRESGMFQAYVAAGARNAQVVATAPDGSVTKATVTFSAVPVVGDILQGFHVSEPAWRYANLDKTLVRLAKSKQINSVVLTIKDEYGTIGYNTAIPMAKQIGAIGKDWRTNTGQLTPGFYDAKQAIARLHELGLRAIGRITCFLDPNLAEWALKNNHYDMIVQDNTGQPIRTAYGTAVFTNFANEQVRQYNIQLAVEAAKLGFDDIMLDYVRRPEGTLDKLHFPGLATSPSVGIANFVRELRQALPPTTRLAVSVFGVSATRPYLVGQDIRLLSPLVDYVAPMVYPSHWVTGEYKVQNPLLEPGLVVQRSTADFVRQSSTGGAFVVPWLEDFGAKGVKYGTPEVAAQIAAAYSSKSSGFFMWNSKIEYHLDAFPAFDGRGPLAPVSTDAVPTTAGAVLDTSGSIPAGASGGVTSDTRFSTG